MAATIEDRVSKLEGAFDHLATRADLAELKGEFKADMAELKGELRADMAELKADMIKWMVGLMLASAGLAASIALVIQRFASG
ncbi:MAG: hypothetical protein OXF44_11250 [Anaerolineaceae bacterium]|nr:hypothetical protein [Anaerolineaceae bacterium]MCY4023180.1 hypothetical protein [Anaerolineaceae bacterium]